MECSLCYHLKYNEHVKPHTDFVVDDKDRIYKEAMHSAISYYYSGHMEKKPPTLKQVYEKFYSIWLEKTDTWEDNSVLTRNLRNAGRHKREEVSRHVTRGYESLQKFYTENANLKQSVLAVNHDYEVAFEEAIVTGTFPLVREVMRNNRRKIEIVFFPLSSRKPSLDEIERDLSVTMAAYGFRHVFKAEPDAVMMHYVGRNEFIPITRTANDYKRLFSVLEGFLKSVDTIPPFPRPGGHRIYSPYKEYCDNYKF